MGTNYYWTEPSRKCDCCGHDPSQTWHIGKSSMGWCFLLNTHEEIGATTLGAWRTIWQGGKITDEYGAPISASEMAKIIEDRKGNLFQVSPETLNQNYAVRGPNGLLRHKIGGRHCISHGDGTYDLMRGEFS